MGGAPAAFSSWLRGYPKAGAFSFSVAGESTEPSYKQTKHEDSANSPQNLKYFVLQRGTGDCQQQYGKNPFHIHSIGAGSFVIKQ